MREIQIDWERDARTRKKKKRSMSANVPIYNLASYGHSSHAVVCFRQKYVSEIHPHSPYYADLHNARKTDGHDDEWTPLHSAARYGHVHVAEHLIHRASEYNFGEKKETPLHVPVQTCGRLGTVLNAADKEGKRSLHVAAEFGHVDCCFRRVLLIKRNLQHFRRKSRRCECFA